MGHYDLPCLPSRQRCPIRPHDFENNVLGCDMEITLGACMRDESGVPPAVSVCNRTTEDRSRSPRAARHTVARMSQRRPVSRGYPSAFPDAPHAARCMRDRMGSRTACRGRNSWISLINLSRLVPDISNAGIKRVRSTRSRASRTRSWVDNSIGEPQTTISRSPTSTPHQRVARHFAATSWLTRSRPIKNTRGAPEEPPVLDRTSPSALSAVSSPVFTRISSLSSSGKCWRSARVLKSPGTRPLSFIRRV